MLCADAEKPWSSARARETCRGRTEPRRCPAAQRERVAAVTAVSAHFLPFALLPDVAEKAEHQEGGDRHRFFTQALRAADALARAAFACSPVPFPVLIFLAKVQTYSTVALRGFCLMGARPVWPLSLWGLCNIVYTHTTSAPTAFFAIAIRVVDNELLSLTKACACKAVFCY